MPTPYQIFYLEIPNLLRFGPKAHRDIAHELKGLFPECCDDSIPCPHVNDNSGHPEWDHLARSAEQGLKRTVETGDRAIVEYKNRKSSRANIDGTGVGAGVAPHMQRRPNGLHHSHTPAHLNTSCLRVCLSLNRFTQRSFGSS